MERSASRKKVTAKTVVKGHQETFRARLITLTVTLNIQKGHHHAVSRPGIQVTQPLDSLLLIKVC